MNIQAMMKQAQKLQQDMMKTKEEIDEKTFHGKYSFVEVEISGKKELMKIKIDETFDFTKENKEILEDVLTLAINDTLKLIDKETEEKMGKYGSGLSGLI